MRVVAIIILLITLSARLCAQFPAIRVSEPGSEQISTGLSITISQRDPNNMVAGVSPDRAYFTRDGGKTWTASALQSPYGAAGHPALISDVKGHIYFFHLADPGGKGNGSEKWLERIVSHKSEDGGETWSEGESAGYQPPADLYYPRPAVALRKQELFLTWTRFDHYGSEDANCHSNIMFSISASGGKKWTEPIQVSQNPGNCRDDNTAATGAMPAVSSDGKIFIAWSNQEVIYFDRSYNEGKTWLQNDIAIGKQPGGSHLNIPGLNHVNEELVLIADKSVGTFHGSLYLVWADQRNGENDTDIWFMRSTNRGDNWTPPLRLNQDGKGKHQFLPSMAVDLYSGIIYVVYYDRRAYEDEQTDVYLAYSMDGGNSFKELKVSDHPFLLSGTGGNKNSTGIDASKGVIAPVWTREDNGKTSVWTSILKEADFLKK